MPNLFVLASGLITSIVTMAEEVYENEESEMIRVFYPFPEAMSCSILGCTPMGIVYGKAKLYEHYREVHDATVICGACKAQTYSRFNSMVAHVTKCKKNYAIEFEQFQEELKIMTEGSISVSQRRKRAVWTVGDKRRMAELELHAPPDVFINQYLACKLGRDETSLKNIRLKNTEYQEILARLREQEKVNITVTTADVEMNLDPHDVTVTTLLHDTTSSRHSYTREELQPRAVFEDLPTPDFQPLVEHLVSLGLRRELSASLAMGPASWALIEEILNSFSVKPVKKKGGSRDTPNRVGGIPAKKTNSSARKRQEYIRQQELYKKSQKSCMDYLRTKSCTNSLEDSVRPQYEDVKSVFECLVSQSEPTPSGADVHCEIPRITDCLVETISTVEVYRTLKGCQDRSAVGPDGYGFSGLKRIPSDILATIFNGWLVDGRVPAELKLSRTVMIPKSSAPEAASDFRPLTIGPSILRLYTKILFNRFYGLLKPHDLQSGFCLDRSCSNNTLPLEAVVRHQRKSMKPLYAAFLDLSKAFDCIPHSRILQAMSDRGFPDQYIKVVQDLYRDTATTVHLDGHTDNIPVPCRRGVKQGDPLSPYLFALVVDPLLYLLNAHSGALQIPRFEIGGEESLKYGSTAFADDFVLLSGSKDGAQQMLTAAVTFFEGQGLGVNPSKTVVFAFDVDRKRKQFRRALPLDVKGQSIAPLRDGEGVKYLGIKLKYHTAPVLDGQDLKNDLDVILKSRLKPFQKKELVRCVVQPKVLYALANTTKANPESKKADRMIRRAVKAMMHLPHSFPDELIYLRSKEGGLGLLHLENTSERVQCKAIARLLRSTSQVIHSILAEPMMAKHTANLFSSLGVPDNLTDRNQLAIALEHVREEQEKERRRRYNNQELFLYLKDTHSNGWLGSKKYMKDGDKIDALKLRTNLYPVRAMTNRGCADPCATLCRRCGKAMETTAHVLQTCPTVQLRRIARHNFLRDRVFDLVKRRNPGVEWLSAGMEVQLTAVDGERLRPDIVFQTQSDVYVLDTIVSWDTAHSMENAYQSKITHYDKLRDNFQGKNFRVIPVVFGARGLTLKKTVKMLKELRLTDADIEFLAARTLVGSLIVLTRFMHGVRKN